MCVYTRGPLKTILIWPIGMIKVQIIMLYVLLLIYRMVGFLHYLTSSFQGTYYYYNNNWSDLKLVEIGYKSNQMGISNM